MKFEKLELGNTHGMVHSLFDTGMEIKEVEDCSKLRSPISPQYTELPQQSR